MRSGIRHTRRMALLASAALMTCAAAPAAQAQAAPAEQKVITPTTRLYVDPHSKAAEQAKMGFRKGDRANALNMAKLAGTGRKMST